MRPRRRYTQLAIGDCGHIVDRWGEIRPVGGSPSRVVCDECTWAQYGITAADVHEGGMVVWVRVSGDVEPVPGEAPKAAKRKPRKKPAPVQHDLWGRFGV